MRLVLFASALLFVPGCGPLADWLHPGPATLTIEGPATVVHARSRVALPRVEVRDRHGTPIAFEVRWSVDDPQVATIDAHGILPTRSGTVLVTASVGSLHADWPLEVALPDAVTLSGLDGPLRAGQAVALRASPSSRGALLEGLPVTWSSADETVATVTSAGGVMGVGPGTTVVTAEVEGVVGTLRVTVTPSSSVLDALVGLRLPPGALTDPNSVTEMQEALGKLADSNVPLPSRPAPRAGDTPEGLGGLEPR